MIRTRDDRKAELLNAALVWGFRLGVKSIIMHHSDHHHHHDSDGHAAGRAARALAGGLGATVTVFVLSALIKHDGEPQPRSGWQSEGVKEGAG